MRRPYEFPRHPEIDGAPLLLGDEVQLANFPSGEWYTVKEIKAVGYRFDGSQAPTGDPQVWLTVLGHPSTVIYASDVLARRSR